MEVEKVNKVDEVTDIILSKIVNNEWKSGMRIPSEVTLVKQFGVSRSTIRSAVHKVVTMGILTKKQGSGTYVNNNKSKRYIKGVIPELDQNKFNFIDILEFRELIEPGCVEILIEKYDQKTIANLEKICDKSLNLDWSENVEIADADYKFHLEIVQGAGNPLMINIFKVLGKILKKYQLDSNKIIGPNDGPIEHFNILNAIKDRDKEMASLLIKRHLERSKKDLLINDNKTTIVDLSSFMSD